MTTTGARVAWTDQVNDVTYRAVDLGAGMTPRLVFEMRAGPDAMGGWSWSRADPLPVAVTEAILIKLGVLR